MRKGVLQIGLIVAAYVGFGLFSVKNVKAGFWAPSLKTTVEIDGINYGSFDEILGLEQFDDSGTPLNKRVSFNKITLKRDFVTEPSLYLWAKNRMARKVDLNDIHLVTQDEQGNTVSRQVLKLCQPLSWSVEASTPAVGGFNETIDIAVQKVSTF
ncbi:MAG: hypothetical protein AB7T49_09085 [Oligoflexales bacterium]